METEIVNENIYLLQQQQKLINARKAETETAFFEEYLLGEDDLYDYYYHIKGIRRIIFSLMLDLKLV